jgi:hypothetical protein
MANVLAKPIVKNTVGLVHARLRIAHATITVAGTESANHFFPFLRLKAADRVQGIWLASTDLGTTLTVDIGIFVAGDWTVADQTVKAVDIYADGVDLAAAADTIGREVLGFGTNAVNPPNRMRQIWQDAGDVAEPTPGTEYDLVMKIITTGTPAAGSVQITTFYTAGD